jgi:hypothetical protein
MQGGRRRRERTRRAAVLENRELAGKGDDLSGGGEDAVQGVYSLTARNQQLQPTG